MQNLIKHYYLGSKISYNLKEEGHKNDKIIDKNTSDYVNCTGTEHVLCMQKAPDLSLRLWKAVPGLVRGTNVLIQWKAELYVIQLLYQEDATSKRLSKTDYIMPSVSVYGQALVTSIHYLILPNGYTVCHGFSCEGQAAQSNLNPFTDLPNEHTRHHRVGAAVAEVSLGIRKMLFLVLWKASTLGHISLPMGHISPESLILLVQN